ncbi:MAG: hypothetical protein GXP39_16135 [Chloroflexi bacterium]|nr:hypothetical protein [Chloroflexota bacterium]
MESLPAVMIGGPPHSGKSTLAYHLSQALRQRDVEHYVLRAAPDGEGDWSYQTDTRLVRAIRVKGEFTEMWVDRICRDIRQRHLPLLVDVGGLPRASQEMIFDHCTHAVLLSLDDGSHAAWIRLAERHHLLLVADLRSILDGDDVIEATYPILRGTIAGLDRFLPRLGRTFDALVDRIAELFAYDPAELRRLHLAQAPVEIVVEMERLAKAVGANPHNWRPSELPAVLEYLPANTPLALYGRGPVWLYAAIACHVGTADLFQFDPRLGWVMAPTPIITPPVPQAPLQAVTFIEGAHTRIEFILPHHYVDYLEREEVTAPPVPQDRGVVLSGKLPHWLWTALARTYRRLPWLAIYYPQQEGSAIVVCSRDGSRPPGTVIPLSGTTSGDRGASGIMRPARRRWNLDGRRCADEGG